MRHWTRASIFLLVALVRAQTEAPVAESEMPTGIFRGSFVGALGSPLAGSLTIRTDQNMDLVCHYDAHSYVARGTRHIAVASLAVGEPLEVLADHKPGSRTCYARIVQVVDPVAERVAERSRQAAARTSATRPFFFTPTGDRTMAGMVVRLTARLLTLRTRIGETVLALRPDTRFLDDGVRTERTDLPINTHVFVRAGKTTEGIVEAYQVMWGQILYVQ